MRPFESNIDSNISTDYKPKKNVDAFEGRFVAKK